MLYYRKTAHKTFKTKKKTRTKVKVKRTEIINPCQVVLWKRIRTFGGKTVVQYFIIILWKKVIILWGVIILRLILEFWFYLGILTFFLEFWHNIVITKITEREREREGFHLPDVFSLNRLKTLIFYSVISLICNNDSGLHLRLINYSYSYIFPHLYLHRTWR